MSEIPFKADVEALPLGGVLKFGKFKGKSVKQIADTNPSYLVWAIKTVGSFEITREARKYAQRKLNIEAQARIDRMAFGGILPSSPDDRDDTDDGLDEYAGMSYSDFGNN